MEINTASARTTLKKYVRFIGEDMINFLGKTCKVKAPVLTLEFI